MDASGMAQSFDQTTSSAGLGRAIIAPPIMPMNSFGGSSYNMMTGPQQITQSSYGFTSYTDGTSTTIVPTFGANYIQPRPRMMQPFSYPQKEMPFQGSSNHQGFIESTRQSQSPQIKPEPLWRTPARRQAPPKKQITPPPPSKTIKALPQSGDDKVQLGTTAIDKLMKIIQDKTQTSQSQLPSISQSTSVVGAPHILSRQDSMNRRFQLYEEVQKQTLTFGKVQDNSRRVRNTKKKFRCTFKNCQSSFPQKTHLDIHSRKHTGEQPYPCTYPSCNRTFSQAGNLKTHMDRHYGERRFPCETCGKRFGQRSNLSAHRVIHTGAKPFSCKLDGCEKQFTQLGNLKAHHNKFHSQTIETYERKLLSGEIDLESNKEFVSYFYNLYRNSNKGIKGRGKDRNISPSSRSKNNHASSGSNANRYMGSNMRSCNGSFGSDNGSMYDSDGSLKSQGSGPSVGSSFAETASTCSSFTEEITGTVEYKNGRARGLAFGDSLY